MRPKGAYLLRAAILLWGFIGIPYFILHSTFIHRQATHILERVSGISVDFQKSRLRLLRGEIVLEGVIVNDAKQRFQLVASQLSLAVSPLSLLRGKLVISHIGLVRANLTLKPGAPQIAPSADLFQKIFAVFDRSLLLQTLVIEELRLHQFRLEPAVGQPILIQDLVLNLAVTLLREVHGKIHLSQLTRGTAELNTADLEVTLSQDGVQLHQLELVKERFHLGLKGVWKGDLNKGTLKTEGKIVAETYLSEPIHFQLEAVLQKKIAQIKKLTGQLGNARLEGRGEVRVATKDYAIDFHAVGLPLEAIFQKIPGVILGPARGNSEVTGKAIGRLPDLHAEAEATITQFQHRMIAVARAQGKIQFHWPKLSFDAHFQTNDAGQENGQVSGAVLFQRNLAEKKINVFPKTVKLNLMEAPLEEMLPTLNVGGILTGHLNLIGAEASMKGSGAATVQKGRIGKVLIESLETNITVQPHARFIFDKTLLLSPHLEAIALPGPIRLDGSGGTIHFEGKPSPQFSIRGDYDSTQKKLTLAPLEIHSTAGTLKVAGTVQPRLDLKVVGPLQLSSLQLLGDKIGEASGLAQLDLRLGGTLEDPLPNGRAEVRKGVLEIRGVGDLFSEMDGTLLFRGNEVFPKMTGRYGDGSFTLEGGLSHLQYRPVDLNLHLIGFSLPFRHRRDYSFEANTDIFLKGKWPRPTLSGQVEIVEGRYTKEFEIRQFVLRPAVRGTKKRGKTIWDEMGLNLAVKSAGDLQVKNNLALILLSCDLTLRGRYEAPKIEGALTLQEGTFHYLSADFEMTEGSMEFVDPFRSEPYLVLRGEREIPPDYLVSLRIEGYLDNLEILLESVPSRDREDIVSLIAFGMTRDELERSGGLGRRLGQEIALEEASRPLEGILSRTLGVDFQVGASESGEFSPSRMALNRDLTERLSLEFKTDLAPETAERTVQANYYLTDNLLLKGFRTRTAGTASRYQFNLSLRFQVR